MVVVVVGQGVVVRVWGGVCGGWGQEEGLPPG